MPRLMATCMHSSECMKEFHVGDYELIQSFCEWLIFFVDINVCLLSTMSSWISPSLFVLDEVS